MITRNVLRGTQLLQTFEAVSGKTGELLWSYVYEDAGEVDVMNLYTGQFVDDVDGDGVPDIVNMHGGDPFAQPGQLSSSLYHKVASTWLSFPLQKAFPLPS